MIKRLGWGVIFATAAQALQWTPSELHATQHALGESLDESECIVPQGRLLFLHVMKAGGTSVDAFLACHCKRVGCSLNVSLGPYKDLHGNKNCSKPAVCTTHGDYKDRKEQCGDKFAQPSKVFTTFRDPISRVFSLYNYEKAQNYQSLPSITELYRKCDTEDLTITTPIGWLCYNMINHMTLKTFASRSIPYSSTDMALLAEAKNFVAGLDSIIFMDDFGRFADAFRDSKLITNSYINPHARKCELGHSNPTKCETCAESPTAEELELIKQHNVMDMELYNYAAALPNRF